ncbi:MAG: radical SAM protein [Deferrisomatales bacterium]|nr:radical SAM protein [Deferrisomatales bacterium]
MRRPLLLVNPPHAKACEPPPGLLVLAGHLRARGVDVALADLNLEVQERLLSPISLEAAARALEEAGAKGALLSSARRAARRSPAALEALRRPETYRRWAQYRSAADGVAEGWAALSRARGGRFRISDLAMPPLSPLSSADLLAAAREPEALPLFSELGEAARGLLEGDPEIIGVSVTYLSQALPAFALAGDLRRRGYRGRLILGGGLVTSWAGRVSPPARLFEAWDGLVVGPGESALEHLSCGRPPADTPGLLAPGLGAWNPGSAAPRAVCFRPDAEGLPWGRYLAPGPILPAAASRGCYWRRCAFCPEAAQDRQAFRPAPADSLADAILRARDSVGVHRVHLTDDAVPPAILRGLARRLRGEGVRWYGFARLERQLLDPAFAGELAEGGCALLQLGVETASQRLLDRMGKGTRAAEAGVAVRNLSDAGIRTYVYLLFGLPTETMGEAERTVEWAADHASWITFVNLALFHLPRGSTLEPSPEAEPTGPDLSLYRTAAGSGEETRRELRRLLSAARGHPALGPILAATPPGFTSNHAAFSPLPD